MHTRSVAEWEEFGLRGDVCDLLREAGTCAGGGSSE